MPILETEIKPDVFKKRVELKKIEDLSYLSGLILNYKFNTLTQQEIEDSLKEHFLFGYEVYENDKRVGAAFATVSFGFYTLDGYSDGASPKSSILAGRVVLEEIWDKHCSVAFTAHLDHEKTVTKLARIIGFKDMMVKDGVRVLSAEINK